MSESFLFMFLATILTAMGGMAAAFMVRLSRREAERSLDQAAEIAAAVSAQADASRARALELLAEKAPADWSAEDLIQALEMLEGPSAGPIRPELEEREEQKQAWTLVEDLVNSYHRQALDQAKAQFWFSIVAAIAGFGWVLYSAIGIDPTQLVTVSKTLPGLAVDLVAGLFFRQAEQTRQRATALYDRLRADNQRSQAVTLVASIEDERVRSAVQAQLSLHMAGLEPSPIDLSAFLSRPSDEQLQNLLRGRIWRPEPLVSEGRNEEEKEIPSE